LLSVLLAGCSGGGSAPTQGAAPPAMPVTVLEVSPTSIPASVEVSAQTEGARETEVRARVSGVLMKRLYQEGQPVKAGQALFQIDRAPFEIALAQARAQLADARARSEQASREEARLKGLVAQQAVSRKEFDDAGTTAATARASLQAAEAKVKDAELNLSYTLVTAPIAGLSGRAAYSEGNLIAVGSGSALTTIVQSNPLWVRFGLSESDIATLPGGRVSPTSIKAVELLLPDGATYPEKGRVNFAASQVDTRLGTVQLRAEFNNPNNNLLPGQFVRARVIAGLRQGVFLVPQSAVMQSETGRFLFLVGPDNKIQPRPVTVGEWHGSDWVILSGLKTGDKVALDNLIKLRPGAPVMPKKPGEKPAGAPGTAPAKP
jgi:membrane fusion protein (multidrug efflux system)